MDEPAEAGGRNDLLGDVVISVDTARRQAADYDAPLQHELYRLLIHGLLHLLGHDHERADERRVMQREERRLAGAIGCRGRTETALMRHRRPTTLARTAVSVRSSTASFWRSFHHAFEGIIYATRTQPNMRVHFLIAALVLLATLLLRLERVYVIATSRSSRSCSSWN